MSFPEGPIEAGEQATHDEEHVDLAPTDGPLARLRRAVSRHIHTWADRYVQMRLEARMGRRD